MLLLVIIAGMFASRRKKVLLFFSDLLCSRKFMLGKGEKLEVPEQNFSSLGGQRARKPVLQSSHFISWRK